VAAGACIGREFSYEIRMKDLYVVAVALTVAVHFAFIGYLVVGGFLALRWPWTIVLHVPAVVWGAAIVTLRFDCPLTWLEQWARRGAGMGPLPPEGFIDHYITGVLYPANLVGVVQAVVFALVLTSWVSYAVVMKRRVSRSRSINR
jgi:hypothetical protein